LTRGTTKYEDPVSEWLKQEYGDYGRATAEYIALLSDKQRVFCARYLVHGKPHQAWLDAGFNKGSAGQAHSVLNIPKIAAYVNLLAAKRAVDLKQATSAEMLVRIKATPIVAKDNVLAPKYIQKITERLEGGVQNLSDGELLGDLKVAVAEPVEETGLMQIPAVTMPGTNVFGPEWVLEQLIRTAERCLQIEAVCDLKGRPIGTFKFNPTQALRALELVGKTLAMFTDRIEHAPLEAYKGSELDSRIQTLLKDHPELTKIVDVIDVSAVPKEKIAGQGDPDFVAVPTGPKIRQVH
jgi:hypothetical protein